MFSLSRARPLDSYLVLQRTAHIYCRLKAQACFDDHTPRPATRRPHLGCARPSDDKQIMLSILRDHVPSLRVLLKTPLHGSCSLSLVERCANTCTADTVRGPALRGRRAYPATRDAGEKPRCTPPASAMHVPEAHGALQQQSHLPRVRSTLQRDDETSKKALSLSSNGLRGNISAEARSAPQTITV